MDVVPLLLFVVVVVFLELGLFFAKQFLEHPTPLKIGRWMTKRSAALPVTLALDQYLFAYFV